MFKHSMFKCYDVYAKIILKISGTLIVWSGSLKIQRGFKASVWIFNCLVNSFALCSYIIKFPFFIFFLWKVEQDVKEGSKQMF